MWNYILPEQVEPAVKREQVKLLYQQGTAIQVLGIMTAIVAVVSFWNVAETVELGIWFVVTALLSLLRLMLNERFKKTSLGINEAARWGNLYILGALASGIVWGSLAFIYDPTWPPLYQLVLFVIFVGITAGAFNTHSSYFFAFPAFYLPPVMCMLWLFASHPGEGAATLFYLFFIYIVLMYVSALKFNHRLTEVLKIQIVNEQLLTELADSNMKLVQLAEKDELTGIANRRLMDRQLLNEWNRHCRSRKPLSLLFIDLDYFKQYNDTYGHDGGDKCLVEVAQVLKHNAQRSSDLAARFGGEEFAVILPETDVDEALQVAQKIRKEMREKCLPHASSEVSECVTMSIGVATMVPDRPDTSALIRIAADKGLYQAKEEGRDRVVLGS